MNSVTDKGNGLLGDGPTTSYLSLNGCTNFGGRTFVSVPSDSCSSEATGIMSGVVGLIESYARQLHLTLTTNEVMQVVRATADDIDFSTPNSVDPANNFGTPTGSPLVDTVRYPSRKGWDATFGYGRINAYEMLKAIRDARIPPEAMIDGPSWFAVLPTTGTVPVTGHVAAPRATTYDYEVQWAPGLQPPAYPATDTWTSIGGGTGLSRSQGRHARDARPRAGGRRAARRRRRALRSTRPTRTGPPRSASRFGCGSWSPRTAGASDGLSGEMQKQVFVHDDPDLAPGFPKTIPGSSSSSPRFVDLLGDGRTELLVATSDGVLHAYLPDMTELPGFPVATDPSPWWPTGSASAAAAGARQPGGSFLLGAPAVGDLNRDGHLEVVDTDLNGNAYVWSATGQRLATMHVNPAYSRDDPAAPERREPHLPRFRQRPLVGRPERRRPARDRGRFHGPPRLRLARGRDAGRRVPGAAQRPVDHPVGRPGDATR